MARILDQAATFRGYPHAVRTDNGPEFTRRVFMGWCQKNGIQHLLIEPGRPMQNGYIESFNGKFRDERLNEHWFDTLTQARAAIAAWRLDYNEVRQQLQAHATCQVCSQTPGETELASHRNGRNQLTLQHRAFLIILGTAIRGRSTVLNTGLSLGCPSYLRGRNGCRPIQCRAISTRRLIQTRSCPWM